MRNNIIFKFLAVLLCAASLLGAVGSAAGIIVLTEGDLYNKTVEEVRADAIQLHGYEFAHEVALHYASTVLGGIPEDIWEQEYGIYNWPNGFFTTGKYGYALKAEDGTVLESANTAGLENADVYTFSVTGQYMHLVSAKPVAETDDPILYETPSLVGGIEVYDAIPPEGTTVTNITVTFPDGSSEGVGSTPALGFLYYGTDGQVMFRSFDMGIFDLPQAQDVIQVEFANDNTLLYAAYSDSPVGKLSCDENGYVIYTAYNQQAQNVEVYEATFLNAQRYGDFSIRSRYPIGMVSYDDEGYMLFQVYPFATHMTTEGTIEAGTCYGLNLKGEDGNSFYNIWSDDGIGSISITGSEFSITYRSDYPVLVMDSEPMLVEATVPPTAYPTEVTIPPTVEETAVTEVTEVTEETAAPEETAAEEATEATAETAAEEATEAVEETAAAEAAAETAPEETADATEVTEAVTEPEVTEAPTVPPTEEATVPPTEEATVPPTEEPQFINGKNINEYERYSAKYWDSGQEMQAEYVYVVMPEYTLELYLEPDGLQYEAYYTVLELIRPYRNYLLPALAVCLLVFAIFAVYLCCAAGRKPKTEEVRAGGLNCLPLDLYVFLAISVVTLCILLMAEGGSYLIEQNLLVGCAFDIGMGFLASLTVVAFCFAFVAQIKTPNGYWWRNSLCGRFIGLWFKLARWAEKKLLPFCVVFVKWLWKTFCAIVAWLFRLWQKFSDWLIGKFRRFYSLLPMTWQWLLVGCTILFLLFISIASRSEGMLMLCLCASLAIVLYGAHCFGVLLKSAKDMSKGDLSTKVDDKLLTGSFKEFADDLNNLADVAVVAAQKQLKSERMKTELITNVSHDIKTPLTSIINYVDLLQKPHTDEEEVQYLEVLERQSLRLKKLIDDLMEMSKANTGNMSVDITRVDAVESVNQALGEFADKLDRALLSPVFRRPDGPVYMLADGKLVWRVLSNLLGNAVKYAHPGTRLYIDLMELEGKVVISLKNISREELNVDADELMERFVRGDAARNTEGSGLGLNIAKSLTELQKGQLQILVDGDLFKVTLIFPGA